MIICSTEVNNIKYNRSSKWMLYQDFRVVYEWRCPEKQESGKEEIYFDNLPSQIKVMIAEKAIKSSYLHLLEPKEQLKLVLLAVKK